MKLVPMSKMLWQSRLSGSPIRMCCRCPSGASCLRDGCEDEARPRATRSAHDITDAAVGRQYGRCVPSIRPPSRFCSATGIRSLAVALLSAQSACWTLLLHTMSCGCQYIEILPSRVSCVAHLAELHNQKSPCAGTLTSIHAALDRSVELLEALEERAAANSSSV
jgi:hypothetical protein